MNPAPGVYVWDQMDAIAGALQKRGAKIWFTLGSTPDHARIGAAYADAYGNPSGASAAAPSAVTAFATALFTRYRGQIAFAECRNEPASDSGFYKGSDVQLVAEMKAFYQAAKSIDTDITVVSPSDWSAGGRLRDILTTSDSAGGTGQDWCEAINVHPYYRYWDDDPFLRGGQGTSVGVYMRALRINLANAGVRAMPVIWGESGYASSPLSPEHIAASGSAEPEAIYARWAFRQALGVAIEGVRALLLYDYDGSLALSGNPVTSPRIAAAWSAINEICGETLTSISRFEDEYRITTESGRLIRFAP